MENGHLLHGVVQELQHWLLVVLVLLLVGQLLFQCLRLLGDLFKLSLELYVLFSELSNKLTLLLVIDDKVGDFALVLWNEELLGLDLLAEVIFHGFVRVLIKNQLTENLFVLEVFLLVVLKQIFFTIKIIFKLLNFFH